MVQERPGDAEFSGEGLGKSPDAEGFGGVVATVERVDAGFFGERKGPMGTFAGDEGVDAFGGGLLEFSTGPASADADAVTPFRAPGKQPRRGAKGCGESRGEFGPEEGFGGADLDADVLVVVGEERAPASESEGFREARGVAEPGMGIEGEVLGVDGQVGFHQAADEVGPVPGPGG